MTTIIDGSAGITFPAGGNPQAAPSKVLQVVSAVYGGTQISTSSTSYVSAGFSVSITPQFSTSKILILVNSVITNSTASATANITVYRNSTNLGSGSSNALVSTTNTGGSYIWTPTSINYLDSPATTSSTTYSLYYNGSSGTTYFLYGACSNTITLMEIAA